MKRAAKFGYPSLSKMCCVLAPAALTLGLFNSVQSANAAEFLWISAPNWSYSAAYADSPAGAIYFWGLSVGAGSYSFAAAYSIDPPFGSASAFAEASAGGLGGVGAVDAVGFADPYAGLEIDSTLTNPQGSYPASPGSDPVSGSYTASDTGITFGAESSEELNGSDGLQAFYYTGGTDSSSLEADFGASSESGTSSAGDATDINELTTSYFLSDTLIPLDDLNYDPSSNAGITFGGDGFNGIQGFNPADVILVGEGEAASTPLPATACLVAAGVLGLLAVNGLGLLARRRRM